MARVVDAITIVLLACAGVAFTLGVRSISEQQDLRALYWLAMGGLLLRSATDLLKPSGVR